MSPSVISHYRLLDVLGEGGMGVVYRAKDLRLGREVAVKVLRTDALGSNEWLGRFEREARLASALQHPHICTIHELGDHQGQPFIAMERLEGVTVRRLIENGPMPPLRVLEFARQIADALDAAHRRGIIHRDIKPANLFVMHGDHIKVLDFGLAKSASAEEPPAVELSGSAPTVAAATGVDLTRTGMAVGTAAYMSPEQTLGHPLDARTDLFSLGSVLYEMVTGRRAFGGEDVPLIAMKIVNGIVVPARSIDPAIPERLDAMIAKLMAVNPDQRYQTAADLLADIHAALRELEVDVPGAPAVVPGPLTTWIGRGRRRWVIGVGAAAVTSAAVAAWVWVWPSTPRLTERDSIVISSIENTTGDQVFDETLLTALKVQLGQSPFLDIVTDQRVREQLRLMGRSPDERLTREIARDACQRLGVKAMLDGSIAALGQNYVLLLTATDCQTGDVIAREQGEATSKERVLRELGAVAKRMRTTLGESLPSIQRFDVPIEQATTPSLAALKAYALGLDERRHGREVESIAFFNQAIDLDREFASAYATLSTVYGSLGEWRQSEAYARKAFELGSRVSERERLFITHQFHDRVTGNEELAIEALEEWKVAYPRDSRPANALAVAHNRAGRYAKAEQEAREALRRSPGHPFPLSNLAAAYRALGRYADARRVAEEAVALGIETSPTRRLLYQLGVLTGDGSAATHLAWAKGRSREFDLVSAQAEVAAFEGRLEESSDLYRRAVDLAMARDLRGTASGFVAHLAWMEALYRDPREAGEHVRRIMALPEPNAGGTPAVPRFRAAAALGLTGSVAEAQALVAAAEDRYPDGTFVKTLLSPVTRAAIAINDGRPDAAIAALDATVPTELGTQAGLVPIYLRAEAFRRAGRLEQAQGEFQRLLQHRGVDPFSAVIPLAHLGLARTHAGRGDLARSRAAYDELFKIWSRADPEFPLLASARGEYGRLAAASPSSPSR